MSVRETRDREKWLLAPTLNKISISAHHHHHHLWCDGKQPRCVCCLNGFTYCYICMLMTEIVIKAFWVSLTQLGRMRLFRLMSLFGDSWEKPAEIRCKMWFREAFDTAWPFHKVPLTPERYMQDSSFVTIWFYEGHWLMLLPRWIRIIEWVWNAH